MKAALALVATSLALVACGDNLKVPDAAPAIAATCVTTFSGNFAETSTTPGCELVQTIMVTGDTAVQLTIPTVALGVSEILLFDLGPAPTPGPYSSSTVTTWSVGATQFVGEGVCQYSAGSQAIPHGSFTLDLASIDLTRGVAHGTASALQYVLTSPGTACGTGDTETVSVSF